MALRCTHAERKELLGLFRGSRYEWCLTCGAIRLGRFVKREGAVKDMVWEKWSLPSDNSIAKGD